MNESDVFHAIDRGDLASVNDYIASGGNLEARGLGGWTPLGYAAREGQVECLKALIDAGASLKGTIVYTLTPLHFAAINNQLECVRVLVDRGAEIDTLHIDVTPLHVAASSYNHDCHEVIQFLLEKGANPLLKTKSGETALKLAKYKPESKRVLENWLDIPDTKGALLEDLPQ